MVMPCATSSSRMSSTGGTLIVGAVAGNVDDPLHAAKAAFGEQIAGELQGAGDRGAARAVRRVGGQLVDERARHPRAMAITVHGTMTCCEVVPGPFDIGDGDLAVDAVGDRLEHARHASAPRHSRSRWISSSSGDIDSETSTASTSSTSTGSAAQDRRRTKPRRPRRCDRCLRAVSTPAAGKPEQPSMTDRRKAARGIKAAVGTHAKARLARCTFSGGATLSCIHALASSPSPSCGSISSAA